jgi:Putative polyhydroxyalkanoic acid system protein (PHA_gran_rgn)
MTRPLIVSIPHNLGKAEATRRLQAGVGQMHRQFSSSLAALEEQWDGDRMRFRVGALGQTINGHLDVEEDAVKVEVQLPWILAMAADKARSFIQKQGRLLLEKR